MSALKAKLVSLVQGALKARGLEIRRIAKEQVATNEAIDVLSLCVADLRSRQPDPFFVQIGAHDGVSFDPIRPFVEKFRWRGLLVEPQPKVFQKLVENYRSHPQLILENAAVAEQDGSAVLYMFAETPGIPEHASMLASFRRGALEANGHGYSGPIKSLSVPAARLSTLLRKHRIDRVDILQIDTEGFDFQILKMIDFNLIKPELIHFENNFLTAAETADCNRMLARAGYRLLTLGIDSLAYRQTITADFGERAQASALDAGSRRL